MANNKEEQYFENSLNAVKKGIKGRKITKEQLFLMRQFHKLGYAAAIEENKK